MVCYKWLDQRIARFWQGMAPISPDAESELVLTHAVLAAGMITIHRAFVAVDPAAPETCVQVARSVLRLLGDATAGRPAPASPVVGTVCSMACSVLVNEIQTARMMRSEWAKALHIDSAGSEDESALVGDLQNGTHILGVCAAGGPLAGECPESRVDSVANDYCNRTAMQNISWLTSSGNISFYTNARSFEIDVARVRDSQQKYTRR